jgi:hypothetical protein
MYFVVRIWNDAVSFFYMRADLNSRSTIADCGNVNGVSISPGEWGSLPVLGIYLIATLVPGDHATFFRDNYALYCYKIWNVTFCFIFTTYDAW